MRRTEAKREERETKERHPMKRPGEKGAAQKHMKMTRRRILTLSLTIALAILSVLISAKSVSAEMRRINGVIVLYPVKKTKSITCSKNCLNLQQFSNHKMR